MRTPLLLAAGALAATVAIAGAQTRASYTPGPHNIELPADWQSRFIRYAMVDKEDRKIIRHMYVNPEAYAARQAGQPAPHGTLLIMADTRARVDAAGTLLRDAAGRLIPEAGWIAIAAQQKNPGWGDGYGPEMRNGEWEYAAYDGAGARRNVPLNSCFGCHLGARAQQDYNFTWWDYAALRR